MRRRNVVHHVGGEVEADVVGLHAGHGHREVGRAVIGVDARDDLLLVRLAQAVEIEVDHADGGVVRHRPAGAVEHVVDGCRRELGELRRQLRRRRRGQVREGRVVGDAAHLIGHRLRHLFAAIADVDAPEAADAVHVALALGVIDIDPLGLRHDFRAFLLEGREVGPGMDVVVPVLLPKVCVVVLLEVPLHRTLLSRHTAAGVCGPEPIAARARPPAEARDVPPPVARSAAIRHTDRLAKTRCRGGCARCWWCGAARTRSTCRR